MLPMHNSDVAVSCSFFLYSHIKRRLLERVGALIICLSKPCNLVYLTKIIIGIFAYIRKY